MSEGPATLDGIESFGPMRVFKRGVMTDSNGYFRVANPEDYRGLHDSSGALHSIYEGPIRDLDGSTRRMRVKAVITQMATLQPERSVTLEGSGSPEPLD